MNRLNLSLLVPVLLLVLVSLSTFYSIDPLIFRQQLFFLIFSIFSYLMFLMIDYRFIALYSRKLYFVMLGLLIILFFVGVEARGAVRWIDIFGVRIQFSEIFKPFLLVSFASFLNTRKNYSFKNSLIIIALLFPVFFLIYL